MGGSLGLALGPLGVVAGAALGHMFVDSKEKVEPDPQPLPMDPQQRRQILFDNTFALAAEIAAGDGAVSQEEIDCLRLYMAAALSMNEDSRRQAGAVFNSQRREPRSFTAMMNELAEAWRHDRKQRLKVMELFVSLALCDGPLSARQDRQIRALLSAFRLPTGPWEKICVRSLPPFAAEAEILGCPPESSLDEMRAAWREICKNCHPDRLGQVSDEERQAATAKLQRATEAYRRLPQ
jgi:DnaJ like chaperone protein